MARNLRSSGRIKSDRIEKITHLCYIKEEKKKTRQINKGREEKEKKSKGHQQFTVEIQMCNLK